MDKSDFLSPCYFWTHACHPYFNSAHGSRPLKYWKKDTMWKRKVFVCAEICGAFLRRGWKGEFCKSSFSCYPNLHYFGWHHDLKTHSKLHKRNHTENSLVLADCATRWFRSIIWRNTDDTRRITLENGLMIINCARKACKSHNLKTNSRLHKRIHTGEWLCAWGLQQMQQNVSVI